MGIRGTIVGLELSDKEEIYMVPEGKVELKIGTRTFILNAGQMFTRQDNKPLDRPKKIDKKRRDRMERRSGARDNERESGFGERTQTKNANTVEKCIYR